MGAARRTFVDRFTRPNATGHKAPDTGHRTSDTGSPSPITPRPEPARSEGNLPIWHSVDYPQSWSLPPRTHVLRGWCFADDARKLDGIRAIAICPGFVETEMSGGKGAAERFPALVKGSCLQRGGQPEEIGELASFLASDRATYITGAVIPVDGVLRKYQF